MAQAVAISHPEKILFPEDGITKGELAAYYEAIAPLMLPHLCGRPITMERFPNGIGQGGFLQKSVVKGFPAWLERVETAKKGGTVHYPLACDERSLMWLANQNTITPHVWTARVPNLFQPDVLVVDLDPSIDDIAVLLGAALLVRDVLAELGLTSWVKTSGSKGYHILVPLDGRANTEEVAAWAQRLAELLVRRDPQHLTLEFTKVERGARIYVDVGRNGYSATFAAAYAVRPKRGAPVSAPCTWDEIERGTVAPATFTVRNMADRVARAGDPWADMRRRKRSLGRAIQKLGQLYSR
jgi:bifunctional non-homologous end joining protein LigD